MRKLSFVVSLLFLATLCWATVPTAALDTDPGTILSNIETVRNTITQISKIKRETARALRATQSLDGLKSYLGPYKAEMDSFEEFNEIFGDLSKLKGSSSEKFDQLMKGLDNASEASIKSIKRMKRRLEKSEKEANKTYEGARKSIDAGGEAGAAAREAALVSLVHTLNKKIDILTQHFLEMKTLQEKEKFLMILNYENDYRKFYTPPSEEEREEDRRKGKENLDRLKNLPGGGFD